MQRGGSGVMAHGGDEFTPPQVFERSLGGAFGKSGSVGQVTKTSLHRPPPIARRLPIKIEISEISGWLAVVPNDIA